MAFLSFPSLNSLEFILRIPRLSSPAILQVPGGGGWGLLQSLTDLKEWKGGMRPCLLQPPFIRSTLDLISVIS